MWFLFHRLQDCSSSSFCCLPSYMQMILMAFLVPLMVLSCKLQHLQPLLVLWFSYAQFCWLTRLKHLSAPDTKNTRSPQHFKSLFSLNYHMKSLFFFSILSFPSNRANWQKHLCATFSEGCCPPWPQLNSPLAPRKWIMKPQLQLRSAPATGGHLRGPSTEGEGRAFNGYF